MKDMYKNSSYLIDKLRNHEEQVLRDIMRQVLNREPTIEDCKDFQRIFLQGEANYTLAYKGIDLGKVVFNTGYDYSHVDPLYRPNKAGVSFEPFNSTEE